MIHGEGNTPEERAESQHRYHEEYLKELNEENKKTVKKVTAILWCAAMAGWAFFIVMDVISDAGLSKLLFHIVGAAVTALLALPRLMDFIASKKKRDTDTEA